MSRSIEVDVGMADGVLLDYLVAMAEGHEVTIIDKPEYGVGKQVYISRDIGRVSSELVAFRPSRNPDDWAPLIDKYKINLNSNPCEPFYLGWKGNFESWSNNACLAICRVAVKIKLGEFVHVPLSLALSQEVV